MAEVGVIYRPTKFWGRKWIRRKVLTRFDAPGTGEPMLQVIREDRPDKQVEYLSERWFDAIHVAEGQEPVAPGVHYAHPVQSVVPPPYLRTIEYCARCGEIAGSATGFTPECVGNLRPQHDVHKIKVQLPEPRFAPEYRR